MVHLHQISFSRRHWLQLGLVSALSASLKNSSLTTNSKFPVDIDIDTLSSGRLIFRGTRSREGQVVRWFDEQSEFTHVGILANQTGSNNQWNVIHATPDHAKVILENLDDFLKTPGIFSACVFKWNLPFPKKESDIAHLATQWIGTPFDGKFDFDNPSLYCTELVWKAAQSLHWVSEPRLRTLHTPLGTKRVLLISHLLEQLPITRLM